MKLKIIALVGLGGVLVAAVAGAQMLRSNYDEPRHTVVHSADRFEIRQYEPRIVAETTVTTDDWRESTSVGFGRLAGFIFGENKTDDGDATKIAMTTPVESAPTVDGQYIVVFTMPPGSTLRNMPKPNDPRVEIREVPTATVATLRFGGVARKKDIPGLSAKLLELVREQGYSPTSPVKIAQYDPPWIPGLLRRNELMVDVQRD